MERPVNFPRALGHEQGTELVTVEAASATVDHSDIRGSSRGARRHGRDPSGAASDWERESDRKACRIVQTRVLLSVGPLDRPPFCPALMGVADLTPPVSAAWPAAPRVGSPRERRWPR